MQGAGHLLASSWFQDPEGLHMHKDGGASMRCMSGAGVSLA